MDINTRSIILAFATVLGIATLISFIQIGIFKSPLTTSAVVLAAAVGTLLVTYQTGDRQIEVTGTILGGAGITIAVLYSVLQLASGSIVLTLSLGFLSVMFLGVAYIIQSDEELIQPVHLKIAFGVTLILAVLIIGIDVTMAAPHVEVTQYDTIQQAPPENGYGSQYTVGEVVITNDALLPQSVNRDEMPANQACLTGVEASHLTNDTEEAQHLNREFQNMHLSYDTPYDPLLSYESHQSQLRFPDHFARMIEQSDRYELSEITIQTSEECPETTETPTVTILEGDQPQNPRPVPV